MSNASIHEYQSTVIWEGNLGRGTADYSSYSRRFRVCAPNKADLVCTADPVFRGEPDKYNPEDLLVVSVASCHMLVYLSLCAGRGVTVLDYRDEPCGVLKLFPAGGGSFEQVTLHPTVMIQQEAQVPLALELHEKANELCFIANSCKFPIFHEARILVQSAGRPQ